MVKLKLSSLYINLFKIMQLIYVVFDVPNLFVSILGQFIKKKKINTPFNQSQRI